MNMQFNLILRYMWYIVCIQNIYVALLSLLQNTHKKPLPILFTGPTKALQPGGTNHAA